MLKRFGLLGAWSALVAVYFFWKAPITLEADWTHDDLMNCYRAMEYTYARIWHDIAFFWQPTPFFRPLGQLWYKLIFDQWHMAQLPQRVIMSAFLLANAYLLGHLAYRMSKNLACGLAAMALAAFHPHWTHLYLNTGTIYEVLAFFFVYLGLLAHVEFREKLWGIAPVMLCFVLALNAKESGMVLAPLVVLYEVVFFRRIPWLASVLFAASGVAFILGRIYGPEGLSSIGMYKPEYTPAMYFTRFRGYFSELVLWKSAPVWACLALCALPALTRTTMGVFAAMLFPVAILPLAFVPERGLEGVYIACAALPLGLASFTLLPKKEWQQVLVAAAIWGGAAATFPAQRGRWGWEQEQKDIRAFHEGLQRLAPQMPPGVQVRFVKEPFPVDSPWASVFATRLLYRDLTIDVAGENNPHTKNNPTSKDFAVFSWVEGRMVRLK
jgi:hypothetical protein